MDAIVLFCHESYDWIGGDFRAESEIGIEPLMLGPVSGGHAL
jgi:hypothetical protein